MILLPIAQSRTHGHETGIRIFVIFYFSLVRSCFAQFLRDRFRDDLTLAEGIKLGKEALEAGQGGAIRENTLEVAVLDRARPGRRFRRFSAPDLRELLAKASLGS